MKSNNHSNSLLVELLIVILFFMLSATLLLRVFSAARTQSDRAREITQALTAAQNVAEQMYAFPEEDVLAANGFAEDQGVWTLDNGQYTLIVTSLKEDRPNGVMLRHEIRGEKGDETLFTLPVTRYLEVQP